LTTRGTARVAARTARRDRGAGLHSGQERVYDPQAGHGRDSIASRSKADTPSARCQENPHDRHETTRLPTIHRP